MRSQSSWLPWRFAHFSCSIAVAIVVEVAKADKEKQAAGEKDEEQGK